MKNIDIEKILKKEIPVKLQLALGVTIK